MKYSLKNIESEWASIYYSIAKDQQGPVLSQLLDKTVNLAEQYPGAAEPGFGKPSSKLPMPITKMPFPRLAPLMMPADLAQ